MRRQQRSGAPSPLAVLLVSLVAALLSLLPVVSARSAFERNRYPPDHRTDLLTTEQERALAIHTARVDSGLAYRDDSLPARELSQYKEEDFVLLASVDGRLSARDRKSGKLRWELVTEEPAVRTTYHRANTTRDREEVDPDDLVEWIVGPTEDGELFYFTPVKDGCRLEKLDVTVKDIMQNAPYRPPGVNKVYNGRKTTVTYALNARTGLIERIFSADGTAGPVNGRKCPVTAMSSLVGEGCEIDTGEPDKMLMIGRTEYTITIQNWATGELLWTIKFNEWTPNNSDMDLREQHQRPIDNRYIYSRHDGTIFGFDRDEDPSGERKPIFTAKLDTPVVRVFDVLSPTDDNKDLVILPQPPFKSADFDPALLDRTYVGATSDGAWFALSEQNFPYVTNNAEGASCYNDVGAWPMLPHKQRQQLLIGTHKVHYQPGAGYYDKQRIGAGQAEYSPMGGRKFIGGGSAAPTGEPLVLEMAEEKWRGHGVPVGALVILGMVVAAGLWVREKKPKMLRWKGKGRSVDRMIEDVTRPVEKPMVEEVVEEEKVGEEKVEEKAVEKESAQYEPVNVEEVGAKQTEERPATDSAYCSEDKASVDLDGFVSAERVQEAEDKMEQDTPTEATGDLIAEEQSSTDIQQHKEVESTEAETGVMENDSLLQALEQEETKKPEDAVSDNIIPPSGEQQLDSTQELPSKTIPEIKEEVMEQPQDGQVIVKDFAQESTTGLVGTASKEAAPGHVKFVEAEVKPADDKSSDEAGTEEIPKKKKYARGRRGGKKKKKKTAAPETESVAEPVEEQKVEVEIVTAPPSPPVIQEELRHQNDGEPQGPVTVISSGKLDNNGGHDFVLNRLEIFEQDMIGSGSQGTTVHKGKWEGRTVAVKRILTTHADLAQKEVRLLQEADFHQNVVRYYCQQQQGSFLYIALELCPGSLHDLIIHPERFGALTDLFDPQDCIHQIAQGLHHLHQLKIVHRDLKPQNILVGEPLGRAKKLRYLISDFGLCKKLQADEYSFGATTAQHAGTIGWRAPELLDNGIPDRPPSDPWGPLEPSGSSSTLDSSLPGTTHSLLDRRRATRAIDIFAFGCVAYFVLTRGHHPFGERYYRELNILNNKPSVHHLAAFPEAKDLITAMIRHNPRERPDTAAISTHPFFWPAEKRLQFICEVSDRFEIIKDAIKSARNLKTAPYIPELEDGFKETLAPKTRWVDCLDKAMQEELFATKRRGYDTERLLDLLRAIRNKKHHWQDMSAAAKKATGAPPERYWRYWEGRFAGLLMHCYGVVVRRWEGFVKRREMMGRGEVWGGEEVEGEGEEGRWGKWFESEWN